MFQYKYKFKNKAYETTFGSVHICNIIFEPSCIEEALLDIIFQKDNLEYMFAENNINNKKLKEIYARFVPNRKLGNDLGAYVQKSIQNNRAFYSFLAEGVLGLVFRDIYNFNLMKGIIDIGHTLNDSHTGVDACMYNSEKKVIVLGEAKFYGSFRDGMNAIIKDFTEKNLENKIDHLQRATQNSVVIRNLDLDSYTELTIEQFSQQNIIFAGFVLHSENSIKKYSQQNMYDNYKITSSLIKNNVKNNLQLDEHHGAYEAILIHLPIDSKLNLITKVIQLAIKKKEALIT